MMNNDNLQEVYCYQGSGNRTRLNMKVLVDVQRQFTETDKRNIRDCADKLVELLNKESYAIHPETKKDGIEERNGIVGLFEGSEIFVKEIPNEYHPNGHPWLMVTTKIGHIKIGWRKSVINIDWSETIVNEKAETLFVNEDVTKDKKSIHAHGYTKAKQYLNVLLKTNNVLV